MVITTPFLILSYSMVVQEKSKLLRIWADHFQKLAESMLGTNQKWEEKIRAMVEDSYGNED